MKRTLTFLLSLFAVTAHLRADDSLCKISETAMGQAAAIRGLTEKRDVPCYIRNRKEVEAYVLEAIETQLPPGRLEAEAVVYRAIGMIPPGFKYKEGLVTMYTEQLGGYYDPERDHYVMAAWIPAALQMPVAVHELTHALQDQHYDLDKFTDPKLENSDALLARSALLEGDATAVMLDHSRKLMGQGGIAGEADVSGPMLQNVLAMGMLASMKEVPEALKVMLIFPYTSGLNFAHQLLRRGGYRKIDEAFRKPPRSTEEVLHPELYGKKDPDFVTLPEPKLGESESTGAKSIYRDTVGEFGISALLSNFTADRASVARAAAGWGGDRLALYALGESRKYALRWEIHWDTENDAREFFEAYKGSIVKRDLNPPPGEGDTVSGTLPAGEFITLSRNGKEILLSWSAPPEGEGK